MRVLAKKVGSHTFHYNNYRRRKSSGGFRLITAPDVILKGLQKEFADLFYEKVAHEFSDEITGFRRGISIKENAEVHTNKEWVINIDIKSFFPNTDSQLVEWAVKRSGITTFKGFPFDEIIELLTLNGSLPQGSPASPVIANYVALHFIDPLVKMEINNQMGWMKYDYTRYADDITFSFNSDGEIKRELLREIVTNICATVSSETPYTIAHDKIHVRHKSQRQYVTGIIVNEGFSIKKEDRNRLRAVMHKVRNGDLDLDEKILGKLNFVREINPELYCKLTEGVTL